MIIAYRHVLYVILPYVGIAALSWSPTRGCVSVTQINIIMIILQQMSLLQFLTLYAQFK